MGPTLQEYPGDALKGHPGRTMLCEYILHRQACVLEILGQRHADRAVGRQGPARKHRVQRRVEIDHEVGRRAGHVTIRCDGRFDDRADDAIRQCGRARKHQCNQNRESFHLHASPPMASDLNKAVVWSVRPSSRIVSEGFQPQTPVNFRFAEESGHESASRS